MADVTELLMEDHRRVEDLFAQYGQEPDPALLRRICDELDEHTAIEEELVYPRLQAIDPELESHAEHEHGQAKEIIGQLREQGCDGPIASRLAAKLQQAVTHHVQEEETRAFPEMRERLGSEMVLLGEQVGQRKAGR